MTPVSFPTEAVSAALTPAFDALKEFRALRLSGQLGPDQKAMTKTALDHLETAIRQAGVPIAAFVADDRLEPYLSRLSKNVSAKYVEHLKDIWRQAFRHLCAKGLLSLDYSRCAVPSKGKDPHDPDQCERGYAEAWLGIYPRCAMPKHTARAAAANGRVSPRVVHECRLVVENVPEQSGRSGSCRWLA